MNSTSKNRCSRCHKETPGLEGRSWCDPCHQIEIDLANNPRPVRMPEPHSRPPRYFPPDPDSIRVRYGNHPRCIISTAAKLAMQEAIGLT